MPVRLVILGILGALIASAASGVPAGALPGAALGSGPLLIVERAVAFFAAWLLFVVVVVQAQRGHLPTEISGRGVRYAEADAVGKRQAKMEAVAHRHEVEIAQLREAVVSLDRRHSNAKEID